MKLLDGKAVAAAVRARVAGEVRAFGAVRLDVVLVGENAASAMYVKNKARAAAEVGVESQVHHLAAATPESSVVELVRALSRNPAVDGVLVQLPLPGGMREREVLAALDPAKDVDGLTAVSAGRLFLGADGLVPCTPLGVMELLRHTGVKVAGARAVVVGRSNLVGKPVALLLQRANATVTMCHSQTRDLAAEVARAEIVVAAIGKPAAIQGDWIAPGAVVIDVGINRLADGRLVGDVEFFTAAQRAAWITPVPGGVGPMTVAMLLANTVAAAKARRGTTPPT